MQRLVPLRPLGRVLLPAADQAWGDRVGRLIDPAHHVWNVASRTA